MYLIWEHLYLKKTKFAIVAFLLFVTIDCKLTGQDLQLTQFKIDHGLSRGIIKSTMTDTLGYLWSASDEGVIRSDGVNSDFYNNLLPQGFAKGFYLTKDSKLLVFHDFGVEEIQYTHEPISSKSIIPSNDKNYNQIRYPKSIYEDSDGILWISEIQSLIAIKDTLFKRYDFPDSDISESLLKGVSICEDQFSNLWAISNTGTLYLFDRFLNKFIKKKTDIKLKNVHFFDNTLSGMLVADSYGISRLILDSKVELIKVERLHSINNIRCGKVTEDNKLVLGTLNNGLYIINLPIEYSIPKKLEAFDVHEIFSIWDDENGVWISSSEGVYLLFKTPFNRINFEDNSIYIHSISAYENEVLVATGFNTHLFEFDGIQWHLKESIRPPPQTSIVNAIQDEKYIWMGGFNGLIYKYNKEADQYEIFDKVKPGSKITDMHLDNQNCVWVVGNDIEGLVRICPNGELSNYNNNGLQNTRVIVEGNGSIYCGGSGKSYLFQFDPDQNRFIDISRVITNTSNVEFEVHDLMIEGNNLYIASNIGLYKLDILTGALNRVPELSDNDEPVFSISKTNDQEFWFSTFYGLTSINPTGQTNYNPSNGLPTRTLNPRALVSTKNRLWIGTIRGLYYKQYNLRKIAETRPPVIKSILVNGIDIPILSNRLLSNKSTLVVDILPLSFPVELNRIQYRIPQEDSSWVQIGTNTQIIIPKLSSGSYQLEIRSQQLGKIWSKPLIYKFKIDKPWYFKLQWIVVSLLSLFLLVMFFSKVYNWNLKKKNRNLERVINERTREIEKQNGHIIEQKNQIIQQKEKLLHSNKLFMEMELKNKELHELQLIKDLEDRSKKLTTITLRINQKNETLKDIKSKLSEIQSNIPDPIRPDLKRVIKEIDFSFKLEKDWDEFSVFFEQVYTGFYKNIKKKYPQLNTSDLRHCALIRLNLSINEAANLLRVSPGSIKTFRFRLRKKMGLETQEHLWNEIFNT